MAPKPEAADRFSHPGELLERRMGELGMSPAELAKRVSEVSEPCDAHWIERIVEGRTMLTARLAVDFQSVLDSPSAEELLALRVSHEIARTKRRRGRRARPKTAVWLSSVEETMRDQVTSSKRDQILDAVISLAALPVSKISPGEITAAAGVARVTFYGFFEGGKDEILKLAFTKAATEITEHLERALAQDPLDLDGLLRWGGRHRQKLIFCLQRGPEIDVSFYGEMFDRITNGPQEELLAGAIAAQLRLAAGRGQERIMPTPEDIHALLP